VRENNRIFAASHEKKGHSSRSHRLTNLTKNAAAAPQQQSTTKEQTMALYEKYQAEIDSILARYPQKRSAVLNILYIAQDEYGHLTDAAIREVAVILDLPATDVFEVVGFYTLLYDEPIGKWVVQVCDDVPCCFRGAEDLIGALEQSLGIRADQTTADNTFTLQRVKCLAACDKAPILQANLDYYYNMTPDKVDTFLRELREKAARGDKLSISGRLAEV
jgi:NADH-quinone oxidoreductase subunit E